MATPRSEFVPGQILPGSRYRLIREVGQGGMGTVFEVEHVELGKRFVLKAVLHAGGAELVQRLREEWKALGRLEHPNIVSVTDAGTSQNGVPFFVMERLQGEDLQNRLRRERRLPIREAVRIGCEVLAALDAAHQIGVVHRDVKPSNVFLPRRGPTKLLDFGVAKLLDSEFSLTKQGAAVGTPRYMSPEQACGESIDSRSDLYAVGLLLFEMLSGQSPFEGASDREIFEAHLHRTPVPVASLVADVPEELTRLVARLLDKKPEQRPSSAGSALALLTAIRGSLGSVPPFEGPGMRLDRFFAGAPRHSHAADADTVPGDAPTVPSAPPSDTPTVDTRTEVLGADDEPETRTSLTGTRTPPPVIAARGPKWAHAFPSSEVDFRGPSRMIAAGVLGGGLAMGVVLVGMVGGRGAEGSAEEGTPASSPALALGVPAGDESLSSAPVPERAHRESGPKAPAARAAPTQASSSARERPRDADAPARPPSAPPPSKPSALQRSSALQPSALQPRAVQSGSGVQSGSAVQSGSGAGSRPGVVATRPPSAASTARRKLPMSGL